MPEYFVLGVRPYNFENERKEYFSGVKVTYIDQPDNGPKSRGYLPLTVTGAVELDLNFVTLPGFYDLDFTQKPDSKGRPQLVLKSAKFVAAGKVDKSLKAV